MRNSTRRIGAAPLAVGHSRLIARPPSPLAARFRRAVEPAKLNLISFLIGGAFCLMVTSLLMLTTGSLWHWFAVPVFFCGVLMATDLVDWVRDRMDVFDPIGMIALFGLHFFFLAPLLHVKWDMWMQIPTPPPDWRPWLGGMACLNLAGLVVYRLTRNYFTGRDPVKAMWSRSTIAVWEVAPRRFSNVLVPALLLSLAAQAYVFAQFGGLGGYIASYETRGVERFATSGEGGWVGQSYLFGLSESFPILALMGYAVYVSRRGKLPGWLTLTFVLVAFLVLQFLFGGLRGSRSNTIFALFWAVGIVHLVIRPIPRKLFYAGIVAALAFLYLYGFYKSMGSRAITAVRQGASLGDLEQRSGRSWQGTLLGDLARSDIQAYLLYRSTEPLSSYQYALGRTYWGAVCLLIPERIWPDRPETKKKEGTQLQYGDGRYERGATSSRVYGLAGETILNFGPYAIPLLFLVPSFAIGRVRRWLYCWKALPILDGRLLLLPFLARFCFMLISGDSSNIIFGLFKNGAVPATIVLLACRRRLLRPPQHQALAWQSPPPPVQRRGRPTPLRR